MATVSVNSEGIRLQAERVVSAYHALRAAPKNSDFTSADFPVGLFAELVRQIKALAGWLEPADLHEQTIAEIREENPEADDREVKLRVAIRESIGMTRDEEDATYERISEALQS
jgi:hypothetical protein